MSLFRKMSPFSIDEFHILHETTKNLNGYGGRYVLFQETYDPGAYLSAHPDTQTQRFKGEPNQRLSQTEMVLEAGWPEVGVGTLLGLAPDLWNEVACCLTHAFYLRKHGARIVTISVPRLNPVRGSPSGPRCSDDDFVRAVAIYSFLGRARDPAIQIVITGRETAEMRNLLAPCTDVWGVRGSTKLGGYADPVTSAPGQFDLSDRRTLKEIRNDILPPL